MIDVADAPAPSLFASTAERRLPNHGGDTTWADSRFGKPAGGWLDLSTGINPEAYPVPAIPAELWHRLPTSGDIAALTEAAAAAYGVPADTVVPAAGSEAVISLLPRLLAPTKVAVLTPGYSSHASAWKMAGHRIQAMSVENIGSERIGETRILVVGNPNSPDGARFPADLLLATCNRLVDQSGLLVVDEAFADADPKTSLTPHAGREGLVLFRSMSKLYGLAGLRLGFAIAAPRLATALREGLGAWPISLPACVIGIAALKDSAWRAQALQRLEQRGAALDAALQKADFNIVGSTALFRLIRSTSARTQFNKLGEKGILVRSLIERSEWLRIGIPDEAGLARLSAALNEIRD
jgi:cobalamin biosynthetic protein CobC